MSIYSKKDTKKINIFKMYDLVPLMDCDDRKRIHLFSARPRALIALILTGLVVLISAIIAGLLLPDAYDSSIPYQRAENGRYRVLFSVSSKLPRDVHLLVTSSKSQMIFLRSFFQMNQRK